VPESCQHLLIVLAHHLCAFVVVIGQHMGGLMDKPIGLLDCGPQRLRLLEARVSTRNGDLARWEEGPPFCLDASERVGDLGQAVMEFEARGT
jgi:hypothetical protein